MVQDPSPAGREKGKNAVRAAVEAGYTHFDHADIYGAGECERLFGEILAESPGMREQLVLTSKCGIRKKGKAGPTAPKMYDFSKSYIKSSVEGSLARLQTDYLDILLLHRPDFLMNPVEVAEAFSELKAEGKVRHFGVSNFTPSQVSLLQSAMEFPLVANQVEINIHNTSAFTDGTLDQCLELGICPQAWSPMAGVIIPANGNSFSPEDEHRIREELAWQAEKYNSEDWLIQLAWLLKHPANIFPIIGSTQPARIQKAAKALEIPYEAADWYRLWEARTGKPVA